MDRVRGSLLLRRPWRAVQRPSTAPADSAPLDVLLKIYAKCIDGQEQEMNDRIMQGMGEGDDLTD